MMEFIIALIGINVAINTALTLLGLYTLSKIMERIG